MKLLAIESSGLVASVAIVTEEVLLAEYTVNFKKTHSQTLLPMLNEIVKMVELELSQVDAIAVSAGPGSFTGLRIGSATAKGLGLALDKPVIAVPTVDSLAYNLFGTEGLVCPMMDAKRSQVYTGLYDLLGSRFQVVSSQIVVPVEEIIEKINQLGRNVIYLGDAVPVYRGILEEKTEVGYTFAPLHLSRQRAAAVGALGVLYYQKNMVQSAEEHQPVYLRLSQAERERAEKLKLKAGGCMK